GRGDVHAGDLRSRWLRSRDRRMISRPATRRAARGVWLAEQRTLDVEDLEPGLVRDRPPSPEPAIAVAPQSRSQRPRSARTAGPVARPPGCLGVDDDRVGGADV